MTGTTRSATTTNRTAMSGPRRSPLRPTKKQTSARLAAALAGSLSLLGAPALGDINWDGPTPDRSGLVVAADPPPPRGDGHRDPETVCGNCV